MNEKLTRIEYGVVLKSIAQSRVFLEDNEKEVIDSLLDKLYKEREKIYSIADFKIDCNNKDKNEIVEEIKKNYENN